MPSLKNLASESDRLAVAGGFVLLIAAGLLLLCLCQVPWDDPDLMNKVVISTLLTVLGWGIGMGGNSLARALLTSKASD